MSLIVNRKLYRAIDNLLCTKNAGTQLTMVSYSNRLKSKYKRKIKILGTVWDLSANQVPQLYRAGLFVLISWFILNIPQNFFSHFYFHLFFF